MQGALPDDLQRFIARYFDSVEKVEILLLLAKAPDRYWTVGEVFQAIQSSQASVSQRLAQLYKEGFTEANGIGQYRFRPQSTELANGTKMLITAYQERRIKVIEAIFAKSEDQLRKFSDAFRLRKDEE